MINQRTSTRDPRTSHTIQEFIESDKQSSDYYGYKSTSYIEVRDNTEYIVKSILDDHFDYLMGLSRDVTLTSKQVLEYRYNPKKLSNKLYKTTRLWYIILKINGMANVHDFSLASHKLKLVHPQDLKDFMSKVYNSESTSISEFNNTHKNLTTKTTTEKYVPLSDDSKKYI